MHFCKKCQNMYYIKLISNENDEETNIIKYHCRNCGYEDDTITTKNLCISSVDVKSKSGDCRYLINEYTKFDPTLPKTNKIKCPNTDCQSKSDHEGHEEAKSGHEEAKSGHEEAKSGHEDHEYTVIYVRYDEQSLKYIYLCKLCGTVWKSNDKV
jgi:DNA-directed RNA polymerase subunit M/transcription elongation factor TFIIS